MPIKDDDIVNFNYNPDKEPPNIVEHLKRVRKAMMEHIADEEEKAKSPDWERRPIYVASKEISELMTNPDTPLEIRRQLEWVTLVGYEWVHKDAH